MSLSIVKYHVSGMTCGGCLNRVQKTLQAFAEVVEVSLDPPLATLTRPNTDMASLNAALSRVGHYQLSPIVADNDTAAADKKESWLVTYKPLLLVLFYILLVTLAVEYSAGEFTLHRWMIHFMAGFFLVFSFFKLLDVPAFASSYRQYDLPSQYIAQYAYWYPFIELALGVAYLLEWQPYYTNLFTFLLMLISSIGVIRAVLKQQKIRCACLGTVFKLPMSTVTITEDLLMASMSLFMLI